MEQPAIAKLRIISAQTDALLDSIHLNEPFGQLEWSDALVLEASDLVQRAKSILADTDYSDILPAFQIGSADGPRVFFMQDLRAALASFSAGLKAAIQQIALAAGDPQAKIEELEARLTEAEARSVLINDDELRDRCLDLLVRPGKADTAVREASVTLENRIRKKAGLSNTLIGVSLVDSALSPSKGVLAFPGTESERLGIHQLYRGTISFFRNPVSHRLIEDYDATRARQVVGFVDLLLHLLRGAELKQSALKGEASPTA